MKKAEAKVYETEATSSMLMEQRLTDHMGDSIKDEIWTIWFVLVLTGCFLPWTQEYVKNGFIFLDEHTPDWFHHMLYIVIGSSFDIGLASKVYSLSTGKSSIVQEKSHRFKQCSKRALAV